MNPSRPTVITVQAPLLERAQVRLQRSKTRTQPGQVLLSVTLQRPTDTLPVIATLRVGAACASTLHVAHARAVNLRVGCEVRVEAEGYGISRTGKGRARREALELLDVKSIEPTAARPVHFTNIDRSDNDAEFPIAA